MGGASAIDHMAVWSSLAWLDPQLWLEGCILLSDIHSHHIYKCITCWRNSNPETYERDSLSVLRMLFSLFAWSNVPLIKAALNKQCLQNGVSLECFVRLLEIWKRWWAGALLGLKCCSETIVSHNFNFELANLKKRKKKNTKERRKKTFWPFGCNNRVSRLYI